MNLNYSQEYRAERRYITDFKAKLEHPLIKDHVQVTNLSASGLQMKCTLAIVKALLPELSRSTPQAPLQISVHVEVPAATPKTTKIKLPCKVVYSRRLSQDSYVIGANFDQITDDNKQSLVEYMEEFGVIR